MYMSFNPIEAHHWVIKDIVNEAPNDPNIFVHHSTYLDNYANLSQTFIDELEGLAEIDENFYRVYTLGLPGVLSVDVGYGQLAWSLRQDPRVINLERTNIRHLRSDQLAEAPSLAVIDASFISLDKVLPVTLSLLGDGAEVVALIKPQFEVGRGQVGKGGVVRDPKQHTTVVARIEQLATELGCLVRGVVESPVLGPKGNREFLIYLQKIQQEECQL